MVRKSSRPLIKVTLNLYKGDLEAFGTLYPNMNKSAALRELLRAHVQQSCERSSKCPMNRQ
jgi:hypothetical protein